MYIVFTDHSVEIENGFFGWDPDEKPLLQKYATLLIGLNENMFCFFMHCNCINA